MNTFFKNPDSIDFFQMNVHVNKKRNIILRHSFFVCLNTEILIYPLNELLFKCFSVNN